MHMLDSSARACILNDGIERVVLHSQNLCCTHGARLLVNCVPMRAQRTAKLTLNSVFDILKLIPLFTVSSHKVTLFNEVNKSPTLLLLQTF